MFKKQMKETSFNDLIERKEGTALMSQSTPSPLKTLESFKERSIPPSHEEPDIYIAEHVSVEGTISFDRLAKIDGSFSGEILSKGKVIIGPSAIVRCDLFVEEAIIEGTVEGNISVTKRLTLSGEAKITGDITTPSLSVTEKVSIRGQLHVMKTSFEHEPSNSLDEDADICFP